MTLRDLCHDVLDVSHEGGHRLLRRDDMMAPTKGLYITLWSLLRDSMLYSASY